MDKPLRPQQQAEVELRRRDAYLRALTESSPDVLSIVDRDGMFQYNSPALKAVLGYEPDELTGQNALRFVHPDDLANWRRAFEQALQNASLKVTQELQFRRRDDAWCEVEVVAQSHLGDPAIAGVVLNTRDITQRKRAEEAQRRLAEEQLRVQLRQSQKMEIVGQLAGGVAHDFNNMLAVISGHAELLLLLKEQDLSAKARECVTHIAGAAERAANLTRQLVIFSRKHEMQTQAVALNDLIGNLAKMLKRVVREDVRVECRCAAALPLLRADPGLLEQVLLNLVVNARDAMPKGGHLLITTETVNLDEAQAKTNREARAGTFVCLTVSDTGTGIAAEHMPRIFEPFFTTKEAGKGTGLGLATVYGIVKQHQGWIEVSSSVGKGTSFRILLPVPSATSQPPAAARAGVELRGGAETILLVEDDEPVRLITRRVLEKYGYTILEACTAREAREVWRNHREQIALLLSDMMMPEGVTGRDLAEELRLERPDLKIVFMSGYSAEAMGKDKEFVLRTQSRFLHKPCHSGKLVQTVRQSLDDKQPEAPQR